MHSHHRKVAAAASRKSGLTKTVAVDVKGVGTRRG